MENDYWNYGVNFSHEADMHDINYCQLSWALLKKWVSANSAFMHNNRIKASIHCRLIHIYREQNVAADCLYIFRSTY